MDVHVNYRNGPFPHHSGMGRFLLFLHFPVRQHAGPGISCIDTAICESPHIKTIVPKHPDKKGWSSGLKPVRSELTLLKSGKQVIRVVDTFVRIVTVQALLKK